DVSTLAAFVAHLSPPQVPALPIGLTITAVGPDPVLNLAQSAMKHEGQRMKQIEDSLLASSFTLGPSLTVTLDDPRPVGSTGMTEAILALTYDPSVLSVSVSDITLGSLPSQGSGWQLWSMVNQGTGQIG